MTDLQILTELPRIKPPDSRDLLLLLLGLLCLWAAATPGATVTGQVADIFLEPFDSPLLLTPASNVVAMDGVLNAGPPRVALTTNGAFYLTLAPGSYRVSFPLVPARQALDIRVPDTNDVLNLADLVAAGDEAAASSFSGLRTLCASDLVCEGHSRTAVTPAPIQFSDAIALHSNALGRVIARVPHWTTQAVSCLVFQWSRVGPLHWTNHCEAVGITDSSGPHTNSTVTTPILLTNHLNLAWFTNTWSAGATLKFLALDQPSPPTNTLQSVLLLEWRLRWRGDASQPDL
jgi:hypothetical protein